MGLFWSRAAGILGVLLIMALYVLPAAAGCGDLPTEGEVLACHKKRYLDADRRMNQVYNEALELFSSDRRERLRLAQMAWLVYRDANHLFMKEINAQAGVYGEIMVQDHLAGMVESRIQELKNMLAGP